MKPKEAMQIIGNLSKPSKMPGHAYSIPATRCKVGGKLRAVKGSVCSICYALKGRYVFPNVKNALEKRFASLSSPRWIEAMITAIDHYEKSGFFRWHDSGDIQNIEHLEAIAEIARKLPAVRFWLPTREYSLVAEFIAKNGRFPENLTVRLSAYMIEGPPPIELSKRLNVQTSGVAREGFSCPVSSQGNACRDCRACWDKNVENINYKKH